MGKQRHRKNNQGFARAEASKMVAAYANSLQKQKRKLSLSGSSWKKDENLFCGIFLVRVLSAYLITTEFVPDEAWQSTEVAYYYTFGRGHLTWEWLVGLRNHIYPFLIAGMYSILKYFELDSPYYLVLVPRFFQAVVTALGDFAFYLYCKNKYGKSSAWWSCLFFVSCWFTLYCGPRTITNTTEMALNSIAMYFMEIDRLEPMAAIVGLNFLIRPTAIIIWIPQVFVIWSHVNPTKYPHRVPFIILIGMSTLLVGWLVDSAVYGRPVIAAGRFLKFNVIDGQSSMFGRHHFLWYFYSALPSILVTNVIWLCISLYYKWHKSEWKIIVFFLLSFSFIGHKEIRFLLPVLPYIFAVIGNTACKCYDMISSKDENSSKSDKVDLKRFFNNFISVCLIIHILAALYFGRFHQGGMSHAAQYINENSKSIKNPHIWIMTPCYSIPVYTYLHNPQADYEFFSCGFTNISQIAENTMPNANLNGYSENSTEILRFVAEKIPIKGFPHFILTFNSVSTKFIDVFKALGTEYSICSRFLHAQFGEDAGIVYILCRLRRAKTSLERF